MIIIINGSLGVGKSSVAEQLHYKFKKSVNLDGDYIGDVNPFKIYDDARISHLYRTLAVLIRFHQENGYPNFVINYVFESPESLQELLDLLKPLDDEVHVFWLTCDREAQRERIHGRNRDELNWELDRFIELQTIQSEAAKQGFIGEHVDTTGLSAEEVADKIWKLLKRSSVFRMDWDIQKFADLWENKGKEKAYKYKSRCIPANLYKYQPLFSRSNGCMQEETCKRLNSLRDNKIWVSSHTNVNDPFEFNSLYIDKSSVEKHGHDINDAENFVESLRSLFQVTCFSDYGINHLPLWGNYANNHQGFCVKYEVIDDSLLYPVSYIEKRYPVVNLFMRLAGGIKAGMVENRTPSQDVLRDILFFIWSLTGKFKHWKYENEFRFINIQSGKTKKGCLIPLSETGLKVEAIYIGIACEYEKELVSIGNHIGCEVYEMFVDKNSEKFILKHRLVNGNNHL